MKLCQVGIPPSVRGEAWRLAIGNELSITHGWLVWFTSYCMANFLPTGISAVVHTCVCVCVADLYQICEGRAHDRLKVKDTGTSSDTDSLNGT